MKAVISFTMQEDGWKGTASASSEDGRTVSITFVAGSQSAENYERMRDMICRQICKSTSLYRFTEISIDDPGQLPFMSAASLNGIRRDLAQMLDNEPCGKKDILLRKQGKVTKPLPQKDITYKFNISNHISHRIYQEAGAVEIGKAYEIDPIRSAELMRTRYCIRYELGLCPVHQGAKVSKPLFLLNNGQRFALHFDCKACEMTVTEA